MHPRATKSEVAEFKRMKAAERMARTPEDARVVHDMARDWVMAAKTMASRTRRTMMAQCVRFTHSFQDHRRKAK